MDEKICRKCGRLLPLSMFHKAKENKDGHVSSCKDCMKDYTRKYNREHSDVIKEKWICKFTSKIAFANLDTFRFLEWLKSGSFSFL